MKRPIESDYTSHVAYTRALEDYCDALEQPEFQTHEEGDDGWSEWVCPNPDSYLMKCCDCGLVHEAQFGVVRYTDTAEKENCDMVEDPNLQAVFRMRRSEQCPHGSDAVCKECYQSEQEPVATVTSETGADISMSWWHEPALRVGTKLYTAPPKRKPLTEKEILTYRHLIDWTASWSYINFARAIEAAHNIKE